MYFYKSHAASKYKIKKGQIVWYYENQQTSSLLTKYT